jgi:Nucleoside-diphosphate-sugar epimerases
MTERIVVTGGAGFIGSHLVERLASDTTEILVLDTEANGDRSLLDIDPQFESVDIRDQALESILTEFDPDTIYHLAALHYIPYCNANPEEAFEVNVMGTRNILNVARQLDSLSNIVFASTAAVYPPRDEANHESTTTGPMDIYGRTKLIGEDLCRLFAQETNVSITAARLFNVYGPNETNEHLIPAILQQVRAGRRDIELGNLSPKRDFIHVDDAARALECLGTQFKGTFEPYNIGTGDPYSVREVVEETSAALDESITITQDDDRTRESDRPHLEADISKLTTDFAWEPQVNFREGLRELLTQNREVLVT